MKKFSLPRLLLPFFVIMCIAVNYVSASSNISLQADNAKALVKLEILDGKKAGSNILKAKIKKYEYISLVVKMLGYEEDESLKNIELPYKDIDKTHKEYNNIKVAYKFGIISGKEKSSLSPDGFITYSEALVMMLNGLGYTDLIGEMTTENIAKKAKELKISDNLPITLSKQLTNGDTYILIYNSLTADINVKGIK